MRELKRTCVVGAGSIGSLFAGHLGSVAESTVLVRRQEHADCLNTNGLRVSGKSSLQTPVLASTDPAALGDADLGEILGLADLVSAVKARDEFFTPAEQALAARVGEEKIGAGLATLLVRCG